MPDDASMTDGGLNNGAQAHEPQATEIHEPVLPPLSRTIYVSAPVEPVRRGNRAFGLVIAIVATPVFALLYGVIIAILESTRMPVVSYGFLSSFYFYVPVMFFFVGFLVLVLLANRAGWWVHVVGSLVVAVFVYFGTVGVGLVSGGIILETPDGASRLFAEALSNPYVIAAGLLSREVAVWLGLIVAARGRRVKSGNNDARAAFEREYANASGVPVADAQGAPATLEGSAVHQGSAVHHVS